MPSLRELQHALRRSLMQGEDSAAAAHIRGDGLAPAQRLDVYRNTMVSTLITALRLSFPAVHRLVGAEFFDGAASIFAHEQPPRTPYLDEYGAGFPEFLARFPPASALAYLAAVARLEWAVNRALHAPDVDPLDVAQLAVIEPADHDSVRFVAHPSVGLVEADCPADTIWRAVLGQDDAALAAIDLAAGLVRLMVERSASGVDVTRIDERGWRFATALIAGQPLGAALDGSPSSDAAALLADHLNAGRLVAFRLSDAAGTAQPQWHLQ
ncbi:MAG: DNA-binding domain-containing protein [Burkholderiaceae bacterium]